jgi:hypothetical protein
MATLDDLRDVTLFELIHRIGPNLREDDDAFDRWLVEMGLLHGSMDCNRCGESMNHELRGKSGRETDFSMFFPRSCNWLLVIIGHYWVCNHRACRSIGSKSKKGFLAGTFFADSKISRK